MTSVTVTITDSTCCTTVHRALARILERLDIMATQADIDALTAQITDRDAALATALAGIQGDLDALKAANPAVDITALQASVAALGDTVAQAAAVDAENPPA